MSADPPRSSPSRSGLRRRLARLGALALGGVLALAAAEVVARIVLASEGRPFDRESVEREIALARSSVVDAVPQLHRVDERATEQVRSLGQVLHPFFGYDFRGYLQSLPSELEYHRSAEGDATYDVVVLGGSVAMGFGPKRVEPLIAALRADPALADRPIQVFCHGRAAHKAPQQTMVLLFLLCAGVEPDAVIALDGFNEVTVALQNVREGVSAIYPCSSIWLNLAGAVASDAASLDRALELRDRQLRVVEAADEFARRGFSRCALTSLFGVRRIRSLQADVALAARELADGLEDAAGFATLAGPIEPRDDAAQIEHLVELWREEVRSLAALCAVRGIDFLEVLQPTALLPGSKPLTPEEEQRAVSTEAWHTGARLGYPELRRAGAELAAEGIALFDATQVFADSRESLYLDTCHFTSEGYDILAREIGRALVAARARAAATRR